MQKFSAIRSFSSQLCAPLEPEDCVIQSMPDVSPARWHLAHTTWFFETFVLGVAIPSRRRFSDDFEYLFNSYYNTVGRQFPRAQRGLLSRPTVEEVFEYRDAIDDELKHWMQTASESEFSKLQGVIELGLHHEQQHQELMLTDIKHVFSCNPLRPAYSTGGDLDLDERGSLPQFEWLPYQEGLEWIGHSGDGFCYDNETPRHRVFLEDRQLGSRLVTNGEFRQFIDDGGYRRPDLWLSAGWAAVLEQGWQAPLYWEAAAGGWTQFTLHGQVPLCDHEPVCHISYYEADAFARWSDARLPTEAEWEIAASSAELDGNFVEQRMYHPVVGRDYSALPAQLYGDVWEWTSSPYVGYPGFRPAAGAIGEYNGKFMCNQFVLRGGSCATSGSHIRPTYRNFFPPEARWQFTGIRLAR